MVQARQIEAFRAVMLTGGMTAAADMIHVTQPAISRLIRDLERETRLQLFYRRGNLVVPTPQAHALLEEVQRSFTGLQNIQNYADDLHTGRGGSLRIVTLPAMVDFMPRFVTRFARDRPQLRIVVHSLPSPLVRDEVADGRFDIGVASAPFQRSVLAATSLDDSAVVILRRDHSLAARPSLEGGDLAGEDVILLSKFRESTLHPVELALQSVRFGRVIETPLSGIACAMASEGAGLAIVDPFSASAFAGDERVVLRRFTPAMAVGTAVVHSRERPLSTVAQEFHDGFVAHARDFLRRADYLRDRLGGESA